MLSIITGKNNPILRQKSIPIISFDKKLKKTIENMKKTIINANGLGLAAPQVGIHQRIFLIKIKSNFLVVINPEIINISDKKIIEEEGCLSLPNVWANVSRPQTITVKFKNIKGQIQIMTFRNLEAREFLHEYDHLEGILFIDKTLPKTPLQNSIIINKSEHELI